MRRKLLIVIVSLGLLGIVYANRNNYDPLHTDARRAWKQKSLAEISSRLRLPDWPTNEISRLQTIKKGDPDDYQNWLSKELILLKNGEWLAFKNVCRKEKGNIYDMFLAKGSDGRWYYSTYHFCVDMVSLKMEFQPKDLSSFTNYFCLRPFDGRSDECLEKTWPPKSP